MTNLKIEVALVASKVERSVNFGEIEVIRGRGAKWDRERQQLSPLWSQREEIGRYHGDAHAWCLSGNWSEQGGRLNLVTYL